MERTRFTFSAIAVVRKSIQLKVAVLVSAHLLVMRPDTLRWCSWARVNKKFCLRDCPEF